MSNHQKVYNQLIQLSKEVSLLGSCESLLSWDQEVYMPPKGTEHRAAQTTLLSGIIHERFTSHAMGEWLSECEASDFMSDPLSDEAVNIREIRRAYDRKVKLPKSLVEEIAHTTTLAHAAWVKARAKSNFATFQPWLEKIVELKRQEADCYGFEKVRYDALLDEYEPGETTENLTGLFSGLQEELSPLVRQIKDSPKQPDSSILHREYPSDRQKVFAEMAAAAIGFDFSAGRLDEVVHPFCSGIGPGDTRITTRYNPRFFNEAFFGVLHEAGHGLYDQGLESEHYGTPRGKFVSLGIHESQSRLWENFVGRSFAFWEHFFPKAQGIFHAALADVSLDDFVHAINEVRPSFIRVEADEATYNLHIILRFELEQAIVADDLEVADIPDAWNRRFK
ncbi:MAG: carboxypeptidase M32, partial [Pirellulales bacterium]|nr:carboxypeptidase M32 [Pirellulales bacterium]